MKYKDERNFLQRWFRRSIIQRNHWRVDHDEQIYLFGMKCAPSRRGFTKEKVSSYLDNMIAQIKAKSSSMTIDSMMIEWYVAADLLINRDLTINDLLTATEDGYGLTIENFQLGEHKLNLDIRRDLYYDAYQFAVSNHPTGHSITRDAPDALAKFAGEEL